MSLDLIFMSAAGLLAIVAIPMLRAAIKAKKANKDIDDILTDALEAGLDEVENKKKKKK